MDNRYVQQFKKGALEMILLCLIGREETYGYEISRQLAAYGFGTIPEGTIYPLLLRLEKNQLVAAAYRPSELGPKRKYYSLTPAGEEELQRFIQNYTELSHAVSRLLTHWKGDAIHEASDQTAAGGK